MRKQWWAGSIAWVLITLVAVLGVLKWNERSAAAERVLTTDVGQQREIAFANGPKIVLNTQTTVATQESEEDIQLRLDSGEVLVDRTPTQSKPVRVTAGPAAIEAQTQARFSIRLTSAECLVRVFDGVVRVRPVAVFTTVNLQSGEMATISDGRSRVGRFPLASAPRLLSWTHGKLIFDGASLAEVVSEFNRYNRERLFIEDESLAQFRIGGSYTATNPMGFAKALRGTFGIRAESRGSGGSEPRVIVLKGPAGASAVRPGE